MITFFNRRELIMTDSMKKQWEIRHALATNDVEYKLVVKGRYAMRSFGFSAPPENPDKGMNLYYFYVRERDFDQACAVISRISLKD